MKVWKKVGNKAKAGFKQCKSSFELSLYVRSSVINEQILKCK